MALRYSSKVSPDARNIASGQSRFQNIGRVQIAVDGVACPDNRMDFRR